MTIRKKGLPPSQTTSQVNEQAEILERETRALELKRLGLSYRKIGEQLGVSHTQARHDIEHALSYIKDDVAKDAVKLRDIEVMRLDDMWMKLQTRLNPKQGEQIEYKAIDSALRIMERRARLLGLDMPVQVESVTWRTKAIDDIRAGKYTHDEIAALFGDNDLASQLFLEANVPINR